jgi:hypothetical protein
MAIDLFISHILCLFYFPGENLFPVETISDVAELHLFYAAPAPALCKL